MNTIKFFIKLTVVILIYILLYGIIYSAVILKTNNNINLIVTLIFSSILFGIIGFGYANHFHKYGLLIGLGVVFIHLLMIKLIYFISTNSFNIHAILVSIEIIVGGIGGILGSNIKKIF